MFDANVYANDIDFNIEVVEQAIAAFTEDSASTESAEAGYRMGSSPTRRWCDTWCWCVSF
ncbi:MAG: hypothetical protein JNN15_07255 [Blastocatellia bacterium]|nr:hypothetical protein [Blastocatellia bacterium]